MLLFLTPTRRIPLKLLLTSFLIIRFPSERTLIPASAGGSDGQLPGIYNLEALHRYAVRQQSDGTAAGGGIQDRHHLTAQNYGFIY